MVREKRWRGGRVKRSKEKPLDQKLIAQKIAWNYKRTNGGEIDFDRQAGQMYYEGGFSLDNSWVQKTPTKEVIKSANFGVREGRINLTNRLSGSWKTALTIDFVLASDLISERNSNR